MATKDRLDLKAEAVTEPEPGQPVPLQINPNERRDLARFNLYTGREGWRLHRPKAVSAVFSVSGVTGEYKLAVRYANGREYTISKGVMYPPPPLLDGAKRKEVVVPLDKLKRAKQILAIYWVNNGWDAATIDDRVLFTDFSGVEGYPRLPALPLWNMRGERVMILPDIDEQCV